jgi:hypothetical protein
MQSGAANVKSPSVPTPTPPPPQTLPPPGAGARLEKPNTWKAQRLFENLAQCALYVSCRLTKSCQKQQRGKKRKGFLFSELGNET